ncbi:MAG: IS110 family transposase [Oscillospiraceae bacterium]|nr:IS110 family transposase [Oscillospiraceae bacterium]
MAEIGDVTRFKHRGSLTAFAGVDPRPDESGDYMRKSNSTTKKGSLSLRNTMFQIMDGPSSVLLKTFLSMHLWTRNVRRGSLITST